MNPDTCLGLAAAYDKERRPDCMKGIILAGGSGTSIYALTMLT